MVTIFRYYHGKRIETGSVAIWLGFHWLRETTMWQIVGIVSWYKVVSNRRSLNFDIFSYICRYPYYFFTELVLFVTSIHIYSTV